VTSVLVHQRERLRRDVGTGSAYRFRRSFPSGPANATVVLAGPGTVSTYDGDGRDDALLDRLTARLVAGGAQVLQCDMPARPAGAPSGEADELARTERLEHLLRAHAHLVAGPVTLVGFSLGGYAALRLLGRARSRLVDRVVLVGTVLDQETFLNVPVASLDLVYGSLDLIGYRAEDDPADELPPVTCGPDMYGEWCAGRLICRHDLTVRIYLLKGLGHTLHPCVAGPVMDPVPFLATLAGAQVVPPRRPRPLPPPAPGPASGPGHAPGLSRAHG
jgi:pimeloyl-ACP methyl ester carboxylesterase